MSLLESLKKAQIFMGLSQDELGKIATLCKQRAYSLGETILSEGESSRELFIIEQGMVEVSVGKSDAATVLVNLGTGQVFGEMTLVDRGARSATVKAATDETVLQAIPHDALLQLCEQDNHTGFILMRNLAAEMSLKLRYYNISGQIDTKR
jgi:CRP-like cAMP-binding protein